MDRWLRLCAVTLALALGSYRVGVWKLAFDAVIAPGQTPARGFSLGSPWPSIVTASKEAHDAGLRPGDRLITVQDKPFAGIRALDLQLEKMFPGDRIRLRVRGADGTEREVSWQLSSSERQGGGSVLPVIGLTALMPLVCLLVGFWAVFMRPREPLAWLLLGLLTSFSHFIVLQVPPPPSSWGWFADYFEFLQILLRPLWPLFMLAFGWYFPKRFPLQRRFQPVFVLFVILLAAAMLTDICRQIIAHWFDPQTWGWLHDRLLLPTTPYMIAFMVAIGGFFFSLGSKLRHREDPDALRRLQTIMMGASVSLLPMFLLVLATMIGGRTRETREWLAIPVFMALPIFPLTMGYAIVVQRAFGVGVVLRQSLQYALARRGVRVLQILLTAGIIGGVAYLATQPGVNRPRIIMILSVGVLIIFQLQSLVTKLSNWIDRRFFRAAYNAQQLLENLSEDVRTIIETRPLLETVAARVAAALQVQQIALLLKGNTSFEPAYALGGSVPGLHAGNHMEELLCNSTKPLRVYFEDRDSWLYNAGLPDQEREWVRSTKAEILLPLSAKSKLLGFIALGPKKSEEPYSPTDLRLLQSVAAQTGMALENAQLAAAVTEAVAQRERLNREVEIAQEVQERLFPQHLPEVPGLDYFGYCRPARGVGGDAYDFLLLDDSRFGFAIGDVSGKGIPAALLMASLQSALRGQAMAGRQDLGQLMGNMNRLIYDSSPSNRYATLFYAEYDPATRILTYCNGGHCQPMVLRGSRILRLEESGPVVGLLRQAQFTQGSFVLEPGDLLVGFTDGISEAMNAADEEWGEEALASFLQNLPREISAREMVPPIIAGADAFAAGHPQHDDMTVVVLRVIR